MNANEIHHSLHSWVMHCIIHTYMQYISQEQCSSNCMMFSLHLISPGPLQQNKVIQFRKNQCCSSNLSQHMWRWEVQLRYGNQHTGNRFRNQTITRFRNQAIASLGTRTIATFWNHPL